MAATVKRYNNNKKIGVIYDTFIFDNRKTIKMKKLLIGLTSFVVLTFNSCTTDIDNIKIFPIKAGENGYMLTTKGYM
ncbi:MAG: hypothetical protein N3A01_09335 [Bacteroidales bacterium]|nr:hypothetical protein [Bacteroidales bacterium]